MTDPTNGAVREETSKITIIFGMNVRVTSCTCVRACRSAMMMPIAMAAPTAGPEATMMVHSADWTISRASAWFMSRHRDAGGERQLLPVVEDRHGAPGDDADAGHRALHGAVCRSHRAADEPFRLCQRERRHQGVELVVGLDGLLDAGESRQL